MQCKTIRFRVCTNDRKRFIIKEKIMKETIKKILQDAIEELNEQL